MARSSGSKKLHDILYPYLWEAGTLNTHQIYDYLNNREINYGIKKGKVVNKQAHTRKTQQSWTMNQVSQVLRVSKWFECVGEEASKSGSGNRTTVKIYQCRPLEQVVDKLLSYAHNIQNEKTIPNFAIDYYRVKKQQKTLREILKDDEGVKGYPLKGVSQDDKGN